MIGRRTEADLRVDETVRGKFDGGKTALAETDTIHRVAPDTLYLLAHADPLSSPRRRPEGRQRQESGVAVRRR